MQYEMSLRLLLYNSLIKATSNGLPLLYSGGTLISLCPSLGEKHAKLHLGMCPLMWKKPFGKELGICFAGAHPYIKQPIGGSDFHVLEMFADKFSFLPNYMPKESPVGDGMQSV